MSLMLRYTSLSLVGYIVTDAKIFKHVFEACLDTMGNILSSMVNCVCAFPDAYEDA